MNLYKYLSPRLLTVLESGMIRFTQPAVLNDPFDIRPYYVGDEFYEHARGWLSNHAPTLGYPVPAGWQRRVATASHNELEAKLHRYTNHAFGIFCVSERADDILLWSHYIDGHRGFVLGFDVTHPLASRRLVFLSTRAPTYSRARLSHVIRTSEESHQETQERYEVGARSSQASHAEQGGVSDHVVGR